MWNLSSPTSNQIHPPALEGEILTTVPPGKSLECCLRILPPHWGKASSVSYSPSTVHRLLSWGHPSAASQMTLSQQLGLALNWVIWLFAACLPARIGAPMHFSDLDCLNPQSLFQKRQGLRSPGRAGRGLWRNTFQCSPLAALGTDEKASVTGPAVTAGAGVPGASCGDASAKQLLGVGRTPLGLAEWAEQKIWGRSPCSRGAVWAVGPRYMSPTKAGAPRARKSSEDVAREMGTRTDLEGPVWQRNAIAAQGWPLFLWFIGCLVTPPGLRMSSVGLDPLDAGVGAPSTGASAPLLPCTSWASVTCLVLL